MGIINERVTALLHYKNISHLLEAFLKFYGAVCLTVTELLAQLHRLTSSASISKLGQQSS